MLGKLDLYGDLYEFPLLMGEPVEFMMTLEELSKTDEMFQVQCDLSCEHHSATNIPLLPLKGRADPRTMEQANVSQSRYTNHLCPTVA
jgi:hypothetical protein